MKRALTRSFSVQSLAMVGILLLIWLIFYLCTDGSFLGPRNISNLLRQMAVISFLSVGMVLVIVSGNIDLSVGSVAGFTGAIAALIQVKWLGPALSESFAGMDPLWLDAVLTTTSIAGALACGVAIGLFQGFWIAYCGVPSFIVTLGGLMIFRGALLGMTKGASITPMVPLFRGLGQAYLNATTGWILAACACLVVLGLTLRRRKLAVQYGFAPSPTGSLATKIVVSMGGICLAVFLLNLYRGIPLPLLILALVIIAVDFLARQTLFGRHLFAIGGNMEAARLSGIDTKKRVLQAFVLMGLLSAVSGLVLTARLDSATAKAGNMFELSAIAACVIGGTSLMGGKGSILGAILGGLIMASLDNGMSLMFVEVFWQQMIKGFVLLLAVFGDLYMRNRRRG